MLLSVYRPNCPVAGQKISQRKLNENALLSDAFVFVYNPQSCSLMTSHVTLVTDEPLTGRCFARNLRVFSWDFRSPMLELRGGEDPQDNRVITFQVTKLYALDASTLQKDRRTDGRTDERTTYGSNTVHCIVCIAQ